MAPKTQEQLAVIRQERRQKILHAALELFALNGFEGTSISKVAQKANISKGLVYNYFSSKDEILEAILEEAAQEGDQMMTTSSSSPEAHLKEMIEAFFHSIEQHQHYWKLITTLGLRANEFPKINHFIKEKLKAYTEYLRQVLEKAGIADPEQEARKLGALVDGITLHYLWSQGQYPLKAMKKHLIQEYTKNQAS